MCEGTTDMIKRATIEGDRVAYNKGYCDGFKDGYAKAMKEIDEEENK